MPNQQQQRNIFIDPFSEAFENNRQFDLANANLNRDHQIEPFHRFKREMEQAGHQVATADLAPSTGVSEGSLEYYSFGKLRVSNALAQAPGFKAKAFLVFEPPVVVPEPYVQLSDLTERFEAVYVHNTIGDGYSLENVDVSKLRKLYWPQPFHQVLTSVWSREDRSHKLVVVNGNKKPRSRMHELYSKRIEGVAALAAWDMVDLYGIGWGQRFPRIGRVKRLVYWPAIVHHRTLASVYKGPVASKYETIGNYRFSLCFENMEMTGYLTEKIFDCLYTGTIPVYWGAKDIEQYVPKECFIDFRQFASYGELVKFLQALSPSDVTRYRASGREFIASTQFDPFYYALERMLT